MDIQEGEIVPNLKKVYMMVKVKS